MIRWSRIVVEITLLILVTVVVAITTNLYETPGIPPTILLPLKNFCQIGPPFLDATSGIGVTNIKTSPTDTFGEYIGLSEGKFAFNTSGPDGVIKCQASQALNQGNVKKAEDLWTKALQLQSNDGEVLIYQENQRILDAHLPFITLIVGATATGTIISNGQDIIQGSYTAQKSYNQDHQNAPQIRLVIANFGSISSEAELVAKQIIAATQKDQQIKAMVDLPALANTVNVIKILAQGDFPLVFSSGSTGNLQNGRNFFHVEATTEEQGQLAAKYVEQDCPNLLDEQRPFDCTGLNITLFIDPTNDYSSTLGSAFQKQLLGDNIAGKTKKKVTLVPYSGADTNNIVEKVAEFGDSSPDLIYFAGDAEDANTLIQSFPKTGKYTNLRVLGGDELYQTGKYLANTYHHLSFTVFAYPDTWSIVKPNADPPSFFCDYAKNFAGGKVDQPMCSDWSTNQVGISGYGYSRPENDVMLSYDALEVVFKGYELATTDSNPSREQILEGIKNIRGTQAFEGASGRISFADDGNPIDKAMLILRVDERGYTREEKNYGTF
jgi:eukaryotic-like serine/threonine-protein kinase